MPTLSRWFIRAALLHMVGGFTLGGLLLAEKAAALHPMLWRLLPAHSEFLLLGWVLQLTMGVAYWVLPRFSRAPVRGNVPAAWLAFGLLNVGVLLAALGPAVAAPAAVTLLGRSAEAGAAVAFAMHAWHRVKPTELARREP